VPLSYVIEPPKSPPRRFFSELSSEAVQSPRRSAPAEESR
jgi:hypothetical protein